MEKSTISYTGLSQPDPGAITPKLLASHMKALAAQSEPPRHSEILDQLLRKVVPVDFRALSGLPADEKLKPNHYQIITVEQIVRLARENRWDICRKLKCIYLYNGAYWSLIDEPDLRTFLGNAAEKMGVGEYSAKHVTFRDQLLDQFLELSNLPKLDQPEGAVLINLRNGTFEITPQGNRLRGFDPADFLTYQLPFEYDPEAEAPLFREYLDRVLPDREKQTVLAEFLGGDLVKNGLIKEEKALFLYGTGANGKSVFHEVVRALLGEENTSHYSLEDLTDSKGYSRAMMADKLVNYASEISGKLQSGTFKQLASGETVSARLPYGNPLQISDYAKLVFNVNELPWDVEQTEGFFRRFLIVEFNVTIPEAEQDKELHKKIIARELSGVFNWVLEGLGRLLAQRRFSDCQAALDARERYKIQSDSVKLFMQEAGYRPSPSGFQLMKHLYEEYRVFCTDEGYKPVNKSNFSKRLQGMRVTVEKRNVGNVAMVERGPAQ